MLLMLSLVLLSFFFDHQELRSMNPTKTLFECKRFDTQITTLGDGAVVVAVVVHYHHDHCY